MDALTGLYFPLQGLRMLCVCVCVCVRVRAEAGLFQVLFSVTQQDLLLRLMLFGSAATVDAVCHLNSWGRCSIPIHSLQVGSGSRPLRCGVTSGC